MFLSRLWPGVFASRARRRRIRLLLLILMTMPASFALAQAMPLKVMSFNVRTPADTNDNRWDNRRDLMARVIRTEADPARAVLAAVLTDAWLAGGPRSGPDKTFHDFTGTPERILFRGLTLRSVRTVETHAGPRYPSDHFPVVAVFDLPASHAGTH